MNPIITVRTGRPGRPRKIIPLALLQKAFSPSSNISSAKLANSLPVSRSLITEHKKRHGIRRTFSEWTDDELDSFVRQMKTERRSLGLKFVWGRLRSRGIKIQKTRVQDSIRRVDPVGVVERAKQPISRRTYRNARPNSVWHADGYHKLILYGIVLHGIVDGFCRTVRDRDLRQHKTFTVDDLYLTSIASKSGASTPSSQQ